jgi:glycosyltransferase involved in cell wall biosynthesis
MKVVMVSRAVWGLHGFGGMERYVYFLSKYLVKNGCEVEIITAPPTQTAISVRKEDFEVKEITFLPPRIDKRFSNPIRYWLFVRNCAKYLKNVEFDVLHAHGMTAYHY